MLFGENLPPAERGRRIAEAEGCFTCHGSGGLAGSVNPGRAEHVPDFKQRQHAKTEQQVREWIRDGVSAEQERSEQWHREREAGLLVMPAYGQRLSNRELSDLVAFVMAVGEMDRPSDGLALVGMQRAKELGCFGCHGPGGRFAFPNPRSLKGYIPSWDGEDFVEMVRSRDEFAQWVEEGAARRFATSPFARIYLERAPVRMPAFREAIEPGDIDALWAYVRWLRGER